MCFSIEAGLSCALGCGLSFEFAIRERRDSFVQSRYRSLVAILSFQMAARVEALDSARRCRGVGEQEEGF